jgi:hypothetical protein
MDRVAQVDPGIGGATRLQELDRRFVGMDGERLLEPDDHGVVDRLQARRALHDQIAQAGA